MSYIGYRAEDGTLYSESAIQEMFDDMLDEAPDIAIGALEYSPSRVLASVDPIAYRCALGDYMSEYTEESFDDLDEYLEELES